MYINEEEIVNHISAKPFHLISEAAEELGVEVYVIGGYVRDIFLNRPSKDIDVVAVSSWPNGWPRRSGVVLIFLSSRISGRRR